MARTGSRVAVLPGIGLVVARPGGVGYEGAREVSNAMINRHPALIAQCRTREDVIAALGFARSPGPDIAVRGGARVFEPEKKPRKAGPGAPRWRAGPVTRKLKAPASR